jgi:hypothetical protein
MEISAAKFTKSGITSTLVLGYAAGQYYATLDDVVLVEPTTVSRAAQKKFVEARAGLISCGWKLDTTPAFTGR